MHFASAALQPLTLWLAAIVVLPLLVLGAARAPWRLVLARSERQHLMLGALVVLPALWTMAVPLDSGIRLHLLYMTTVTLIFGWSLAVVIGSLAQLGLVLINQAELLSLPVNVLIDVVIPVTVTHSILALCERFRYRNLFVYLFGPAFAGAVLAALASVAVGWLLIRSSATPELNPAILPLLVFPEGFLNGTLITAFAVFRPNLLRTYDEARLIGPPG
ncbi:MAG: hypothetical protein R3200_14540 [Xanthomonadales bacterium]|nr:hypothetical protein [Xanthomonadales bacterium]